MPCFGSSKKIDVVDSIVEPSDDAALGKRASSATKNRFASGTSPSSARDGLSSAPTSQDKSNGQSRAGLHSAPSNKSGKKSGKGNKVNPSVTSSEPLSEYEVRALANETSPEADACADCPAGYTCDAGANVGATEASMKICVAPGQTTTVA